MTIITIFALVGSDIRLWATPKSADPYFFTGLVVSFILFGVEILTNTVVVDDYKYNFFFWLDIIGTISLVIDIPWITDVLGAQLLNSSPSTAAADVILGKPTAPSG
jgi:hypothetical protein